MKIDVSVEVLFPSGALRCWCIELDSNGQEQYLSYIYQGYTRREAVSEFRAYAKRELALR